MNSISQGENELREALEHLSESWHSLGAGWDDNAQRYFEEVFVNSVLNATPEVLAQAQQLAALIDQARNSVE